MVHITPGPEFTNEVARRLPEMEVAVGRLTLTPEVRREADDFLNALRRHSQDELYRRLGWMTRAHPFLLDGRRLILPLYHDGFSAEWTVRFSVTLPATSSPASSNAGTGPSTR